MPQNVFPRLFVSQAFVLALVGCSSNPEKPSTPASTLPPNDTPAHTVQRFVMAYEGKQAASYAGLFTKDFVFDFSNTTDPNLVIQYANGWVKNDEVESSAHLFAGYTPPGGIALAAAKTISINFVSMAPQPDGSSWDQAGHQILVTRVDGAITIQQTGGEDLTYVISNNQNAFYLVRGDDADLNTGQPADSSHWYIYRWADLSSFAPGGSNRVQTRQTSWAEIRAKYRADDNPSLAANETPQGAIAKLIGSYERKLPDDYANLFTGDFTYEFSSSTDPTLVQQYATGWFKADESQSSMHLFQGYTPPGGVTLPAATSITIQLATGMPSDDNASADPVTHKLLATRVDGSVTVPQAGSEPATYVFSNNYNVFYLVRGDAAVGLQVPQAPDDHHWYVYRWVDLSGSVAPLSGRHLAAQPLTWGTLKGLYH